MKRLFFYSILIFSHLLIAEYSHFSLSPTVYIVIHGTWASSQTWNRPGGDFFDELQKSVAYYSGIVTHFIWSGKLDNKSRLAAGKELATHIRQTYQTQTPLCIIGHSHGANVAILACQELGNTKNNKYTIQKLYALAPPVDAVDYMPDMNVIQEFYNFFSLQDYVQPVLGIFGRTYPEHPRIVNIRIGLEGKSGSHSQMHDPMIARWIPHIHDYLFKNEIGNFQSFTFGKPGTIYFFKYGEPYYREDREQEELLKQDKMLTDRMLTTLSRSPQRK